MLVDDGIIIYLFKRNLLYVLRSIKHIVYVTCIIENQNNMTFMEH